MLCNRFGADHRPWLALAMPEFQPLVDELADRKESRLERGAIRWGTFPDKTPNIMLDASLIEGRDVIFFGSPHPDRYMDFFSVVYAIPRYLARSFIVVMPFFPTGTMERVEKEGEVATAKTLTRMMSCTPFPLNGQTLFIHFDIHALATRFFFSDRIKVLLSSAVPSLVAYLRDLTFPTTVVFPDDGAKKRFSKIFQAHGIPTACCGKQRGKGEERSIVLQEGDVSGKHCIIVDDLVQSGSTLINCRELLHRVGAVSVSAYCTHGVFPRESWKRFVTDNSGMESSGQKGFAVFLITNSVPSTCSAVKGKRPFEVISLSNAIDNILANGHNASASRL